MMSEAPSWKTYGWTGPGLSQACVEPITGPLLVQATPLGEVANPMVQEAPVPAP